MTEREDMTPKHENGELTEKERLLLNAVANGAVSKADKLLSQGEVSPDCRGEKGMTPLIKASAAGNTSLVGMLIRHKADVNAVDDHGDTGLTTAAFNGHIEVVKVLVLNGADLEIRNNDGSTALEIAQVMEHEDVADFLSAQSAGSTMLIEEEISTDPDDDGPTTDGPAAGAGSVAIAAAMAPSPEPRSYVHELDFDSYPELEKSPYFKLQEEPTTGDGKQETVAPPQEDEPESSADSSGESEETEEAWSEIKRRYDDVVQNDAKKPPAVPDKFNAANEERIEFDALDNKQVRNINEKIKKVLDRASFEVGDYVIDTVFKGSYMAVLKPRSQENKRWRKLKKHPEWTY